MSDENQMTDDEIEEILESGDPDRIAEMLSGNLSKDKPADESNEQNADSDGADKEAAEESEKKEGEESATPGAEDKKADDQEELYVEGKSGKNKIPYSVLENTRNERNQLRDQLSEAQSKLTKLESQSQKVSGYLEKNGIDLSALERGETLDESQIAALEELDPAIAKLARITMGIFEKQQELTNQVSEARNNQVHPVELAIRENKDLSAWRNSDPDRWDAVRQYDDSLKIDPAFKNSSLEERFAEAVKRTKQLFGDPLDDAIPNQKRESAQALAEKKISEASRSSVPRSLTDIGATPATERSQAEVLADLSDDDLIDKMADMTPAQIEKLLASSV